MSLKTLETQVGGSHYKDMPIQPLEFIVANGLDFCQGNVVKYVTRYKTKGGLEDLKKAKHYLDLLIELEEKDKGLSPHEQMLRLGLLKDTNES